MELSPEERRGVAVIIGLLLIGTAYDLWRGWLPSPAPAAAPAYGERSAAPELAAPPPESASTAGLGTASKAEAEIDLNRADAAALERLPGVGPVLAGRILEHRRSHGAFERIEDLRAVRGIGPRLLERLRPCVRIGAPPASPPRQAGKQPGEPVPGR